MSKTKYRLNIAKAYIPKAIRGIIVNPSRVHGPGLLTKIKPYNGKSIGNYVYIDNTINGLIATMEKAKPGERYLLGGVTCKL